jgi:outer membrane protein
MKHIFSTLALLGVLLCTAQEPLSLSDAISLGLERNFDIRIEQKNVLVAETNNNWGEAGRYPTINLNLNQNNSINDNVKTASPFQLQDITVSNSVNPGANINWMIFDGFKVNMTKRRLEQLQAESEGNALIVIANSLQGIVLGYYLATLEQERLREFEKQLILSRDKYAYVKAGYDIGTSVTSDLLLEEGNFLTDSVNFINQQLAFRNAVRNLNVLIGETEVDKSYVFTDDLNVMFPDYQYEDLEAKLFNNNVDLQKQYISQSLLGTGIQLAKAERYPTLSLSSGLSQNRSRVDLSNAQFPSQDGTSSPGPADPLTARTDSYFANFTLSFTLFNGGKINRAIKNVIVQEDIGNIRIEKMENSLQRDLMEAYDRYQVRKQLYGINVKREEAAKTNLEITSEKFKNGSINSFDYRIVQNNYLSASILKLQSLFNLMDSKIELMRLTGGLIAEYNQ